jgi:hypothetical protein
MTHFRVIAFLAPNEDCLKDQLANLLAPYDENLVVDPYEVEPGEWSTYNPKSTWDWWVIGGRFDGWWGDEDGAYKPGVNVLPATDLPQGWSTWAIVTKNGEWHEAGKMGWWAMSTDEKGEAEWDAECAEIASGHADCLAVLIDAHI